jgi:hypothetical protein
MSWYELSWPAQALRALIVYAWYLRRAQGHVASGAFDSAEGLKLLGWELLLLIMVTIAAGIVVQGFFAIMAVSTGQETTEMLGEDERDKRIEARAIVHGFTMTGVGFLAMALAFWQGLGLIWAVNVMVAGMVLSDVTVNLYKFFRYWRGG